MIVRHIFLTLFFYSCQACKSAGSIFPYPNCGLDLGLDSVPTVFNGNETKPHTYPWMVFVCGGASTNDQGGITCDESCGGSIISPKLIVTAAHCVAKADVENTFHLCTYNDYDRSSHCPGDSGGPLFIRDETKNGRFKLVAVASFGMTKSCGTYPAGFARLTKSVLQWIYKYYAASVVLSSNGGAALYQGNFLGQYDFDVDKGYYVQTSTDQSDEEFTPAYLSPRNTYPDEGWYVNNHAIYPSNLGSNLRNRSPSKTVNGWMYASGGSYHADPTMLLTPGPLPPLASQFNVTASGEAEENWSSYLGIFNRTERWWLGRPVYVNTYGRILHHDKPGWMIGDKLGWRSLQGSRSYHSPDTNDSWSYWTGSEWKPASVTVTTLQ